MIDLCIDVATNTKCEVVAEAEKKSDLIEISKKFGCPIFKEQGEDFYRVICPVLKEKEQVRISL